MSLIIKLVRRDLNTEFLFDRPGALFIGADLACDLSIDEPFLDGKVLAIKHSGERIFVKVMTRRNDVLLNGRVLPFNEALTLKSGEVLHLGESIKLIVETHSAPSIEQETTREKLQDLEREEQLLKDQLIHQNENFSHRETEIFKLQAHIDRLRSEVHALESSKLRRERELHELEQKFEASHQEIITEKAAVQRLLRQSDAAFKEESKARELLHATLREKSQLEAETKSLRDQISALEASRLDHLQKLSEIKSSVTAEEFSLRKIRDEQERSLEEGESHKVSIVDLRAQVQKIEEKLTSKRIVLSRLEVQSHDESRKIESLSFQIERSTKHLKSLQEEEMNLEQKMTLFREEALILEKQASEKKRQLALEAEEVDLQHRQEIQVLREMIDSEKAALNQLLTDQNELKLQVEELQAQQRSLSKQRVNLEAQVHDFAFQKSSLEEQVLGLRREKSQIGMEKEKAKRELEALQEKISDHEAQAREIIEGSRLEAETFKRDEKMKIELERALTKAELETLRQKMVMEAEGEVRRLQDELHEQKTQTYREMDQLRAEANTRLKDASLFASERMLQAQEQARLKEEEAEALKIKIQEEAQAEALRVHVELQKNFQEEQARIHGELQAQLEENRLKLEESLSREAHLLEQKKDELHQELMNEKARLQAQLEESKLSTDAEATQLKKKLQEQLNVDRSRFEAKWKEELRLEREEFERSKLGRVSNATQAVMNILVTQKLLQDQDIEKIRSKVLDGISATIDGRDAEAFTRMSQVLNFNPEKQKQLVPVLKKYSMQFGLPAAVVLTFLFDIGNVRTGIQDYSNRAIEEQKIAAKELELQKQDDWKEKNTFNPPTTVGCKETILENILYTTDYQRVMDDEAFQNEWILKIHDFITKDLEMSEDVAINYVSAEASVIKDLASFKKDIHPSHAAKGIERMREIEELGMKWMKEKFTKQKLVRFIDFRKSTFDKFHQEKFGAKRGVAGEGITPTSSPRL